MTARFRIEALDKRHRRKTFSCGMAALDDYFRTKVDQDLKRLVATCFVCVEDATDKVAGYYTLSASSVLLRDLPEATAKKLPRYPAVPVVRLGRLAVGNAYQNQKLGAALLLDAAQRVLGSDIGACALVVDAKDEHGVRFYLHHGFIRLDLGMTLYLPLDTLRAAADAAR